MGRKIKTKQLNKFSTISATGSSSQRYSMTYFSFLYIIAYNLLGSSFRIPLCKFITNNHKFDVEKGRYRNIPRHESTCTLCNTNALGDELNFWVECPTQHSFRRQYLPATVRSSRNMFTFRRIIRDARKQAIDKMMAKFVTNRSKTIPG